MPSSLLQLPSALIETIGFVAGALTTLAFVPQVAKAWRSRSTGDLSATMLITFTAGVAMWLIYGLALDSLPVIVANTVTLGLSSILLFLKFRGAR